MNEFVCKECGRDNFMSRRGLHIHLTTHGGLPAYYHKHFPRKDRLTKETIPFKTYDQYFSTLFASQANRQEYYETASQKDVHDAIIDEWHINLKTKTLTTLPPETFFMLTDLCKIHDIQRSFGSAMQFCKELRLTQVYDKQLPVEFWIDTEQEMNDMEVLIDTREQHPYKFRKSTVQKLSFGDYMAAGDYFSKVSVDRKNPSDFCSSFGSNIGRIRNSLDLAEDMGYRVYFVVESTPDEMEELTRRNKWDNTRYGFIYKNVREVLVDYPTTQIIFCHNRACAQHLTRKILFYGERIWNVDLQYFYNLEHYGVAKRSSRMSV